VKYYTKVIKIIADMSRMKETNNYNKGSKMYGNAAHNIYAQNNVGIESPAKLIEMLYEGVLRFNAQAKKAIKDRDIEKRIYWINRSIAIITELIATLDKSQGRVSLYLDGLYSQEIKLLTEASISSKIENIDEVSNVFRTLLEAWRETTNVA
jgi:flagellar protein FliS